jgi:tripartite-type tricarboxylate transporter receptor subunit TctC
MQETTMTPFFPRFRPGALALALALTAGFASAQADYPNKPIKMVVGFSAGSISDTTARLVADQIKDELGQAVVVENIPGAGATIAAGRVAKAPADGYTILFVAMGHAVAPALYAKLPYDTLKDFSGVATVANARVMLVTHPKSKFRNMAELIADAKARPGEVTYGSSGNGTFLHLIAESMAQSTGTRLMHVPFRGGSEAVNSVMAGTIDLAFCTVNTCVEHVKAGRLNALGYIAPQRHPQAADIPTFAEQGLKFDVGSYNYIVAHSGTPKPILDKLHTAINKTVTSKDFAERLQRMGLEPVPSTGPQAVSDFVVKEVKFWEPLVKSLGLKIE